MNQHIPTLRVLLLFLLFVTKLPAQSFKYGMREFHFDGAGDTRKGAWDKKKGPINGPAVYTARNNWKWVGSFENSHLNGTFYVLDEKGSLLLEGEARMDTVIRGTQYYLTPWSLRVVMANGGAVGRDTTTNVAIFSGAWKNKRWYAGRLHTYRMDDYKGPILGGYQEAVFDSTGEPALNIDIYSKENPYYDSTYYLYSRQASKNSACYYYRPDGSLKEVCQMDSLNKYRIIREIYYPPTTNKEGIAWMEAPSGNLPARDYFGSFFEYTKGDLNHFIKGWLHTQYKDGHCTKTLYGIDGKPVPGASWLLPATRSGIRPDSLNFASIEWKGGRYYGSVTDNKPDGWGRWIKQGNNRLVEGLFRNGEPVGLSAETQDGFMTESKYFAVLRDGKVSTDFAINDPVAEALAKQKQEDELRKLYEERDRLNKPPPLPGPKRVISWNADQGTVTWSDYSITRGKQINPMDVKAGMIMMHNYRIQVVQYAPMASLRTIVFYGTSKQNSYTWSPNVQTITVYPELEPYISSFIGTCSNCNGRGKVMLKVYNGRGEQLYNYKGLKQINHDFFNVYEPVMREGNCNACEGSGIMPRQ